MTHPVSFLFLFFLNFYYVKNDYAIRSRGWEVSISQVLSENVDLSQAECFAEASLFEWTSDETQGRFPSQARLTSCQLAWQLSRLHGSRMALNWTCHSSWLLLLLFWPFFFFLIRGKRSWQKYNLALVGFFWLSWIRHFDSKDLA